MENSDMSLWKWMVNLLDLMVYRICADLSTIGHNKKSWLNWIPWKNKKKPYIHDCLLKSQVSFWHPHEILKKSPVFPSCSPFFPSCPHFFPIFAPFFPHPPAPLRSDAPGRLEDWDRWPFAAAIPPAARRPTALPHGRPRISGGNLCII